MTPTEKEDAAVRQLLETANNALTAADATSKFAKERTDAVAAVERELLVAKADNAKAAADGQKFVDRSTEIQARLEVAKSDELTAKKAAEAAAAEALDAKKALAATLAPTSWTRQSSIAVGWFGVALGVLTSLTTASGLTATLVGLLFTFVGASLLSWFQRDKVSLDDRAAIAATTGAVGLGLVVGLFLGFTCRFAEEMWIRPKLVEVAGRPARQVRDEIKAKIDSELTALKQIHGSSIQPKDPPPDKWKEFAEHLNRLEALSDRLADPAVAPPVRPVTDSIQSAQPRYVFTTQAGMQPQALAAAQAARRVLDRDAGPATQSSLKLTAEQRRALEDFVQAVPRNEILSPESLRSLGDLLYRTKPSPIDDESAKTMKKLVTPETP